MKSASDTKLYNYASNSFKLPYFVTSQSVVEYIDAPELPIISWPNGQFCFAANSYILELFSKRLSSKKRGTIFVYATQISHLLRYCYEKKIPLINLSNSDFIDFIQRLQTTKLTHNTINTTRDANSIISIGKRCLYFLKHISDLYQIENLVSLNGQIQGYERTITIRINGKMITKTVMHHDCFPTPDTVRKRLPISTAAIEGLHKAVYKISSDIFVRKRRYALLRALEITGGRRSEVCSLKVKDVYAALQNPEGLLTIITLKREKVVTREIPVSKIDLNFLVEYIEVNRAWTVMETCGNDKDTGYLFVNSRTGMNIESNTITQELSLLAKAAGIVTPSCPHMFRHRYITKLLVALIEQHKISNKDSFLQYYQDIEKFKIKVQQYTGHKSIDSLDVYIHAAFEDVKNYKKTIDTNRIANSIRALRVSFLRIASDMRQDGVQDYPESLVEIIQTFEEEVHFLQGQT